MRGIAAALITLVILTGATAPLGAQKRGGDPKAAAVKNPIPSNAASIRTGQQLYGKNCRHCHGLRAKGDGPLAPKNPSPADLTDATWEFGPSDGEIFAVIMNGAAPESERKGMKGTLADRDVWNIVNYLRSIGPKDAKR
jgi:mono/diheme cytochrome c family protein